MTEAPLLVYSDEYDISCWGIERLHPADSRRASRAFRRVMETCGASARALHAPVRGEIGADALTRVHDAPYLESLKRRSVIANALEVPALRFLPARVLDSSILRPMRIATEGTLLAARGALARGAAINFAGGYHHAHRDKAEGFCVYADVPIAIEQLRAEGALSPNAAVAIVDLDAHRGNGFESIYTSDRSVRFLDIYNFQVYPGKLAQDRERFRHVISIRAQLDGEGYLSVLKRFLPEFLAEGPFALAFFNAGSDVLQGDPVGQLALSADYVRARDQYVIGELERASIPWVMLPSGGYTEQSHALLADTAIWALKRGMK
jgi:histone deacetylase 11